MADPASLNLGPFRVTIAGDNNYFCTRGSDVDRDGMYLELGKWNFTTEELDLVMEIFYSDETAAMSVTAFKQSIPLAVVEWLINSAKKRLPPAP